MTPEESFRTEPTFLGKPLQPFSFLRQTAAQELGLKFYRLNDSDLFWMERPREDGSGEMDRIQMYSGIIRDAAIVMWVCSQSDREVQRARRKPDEYESKIDAFGDTHGIKVGGSGFEEATSALLLIMAATMESKGTPEIKDEEGGDRSPKL